MAGMQPLSEDRRLNAAVRQARLAQAEHLDAIFDIRDAKQLRLANLQGDLVAIADQDTEARILFDLTVTQGEPPRLWVDGTAYVVMEPDPRSFRFIQETQDSRETVLETRDRAAMVERVTEYMAHRIVDRERKLVVKRDRLRNGGRYSALMLAASWICGFAAGAILLLIFSVIGGFAHL